jgi:hypothetical protein
MLGEDMWGEVAFGWAVLGAASLPVPLSAGGFIVGSPGIAVGFSIAAPLEEAGAWEPAAEAEAGGFEVASPAAGTGFSGTEGSRSARISAARIRPPASATGFCSCFSVTTSTSSSRFKSADGFT